MSPRKTRVFLVTSFVLCIIPEVAELPTYVGSVGKLNCTDGLVFWDEEDSQCRMCTVCPKGFQPQGDCGNGIGQRYSCMECTDGSFSNDSSTKPCRRCQICENREVLQSCTRKSDAVCGDCKYGYFKLEGTSVCVHCNVMAKHNHPDCPVATSTDDPTTTRPTTEPGSIVVHGELQSEDKDNNDSVWKDTSIAAFCVIAVIIVAIGGGFFWYCKKNRQNTTESEPSNNNVTTEERRESNTHINIDNNGLSVEFHGGQKVRFTPRSPESDTEQWDSPTEMEPLLPRITTTERKKNRPEFFRSLSAPAGHTDYECIQAQQNKIRSQVPSKKQRKMDRKFEKACLIGKDIKILDLSFEVKEKIGFVLNPEPSSPTHKYWFHFGILWNIGEQKLKNFTKKTSAVFEYIEKHGHTVEELIQKIKELENPELLEMVCDHVIQENKKMSS